MSQPHYIDKTLEKHYQCYKGIMEFIEELEKENNTIANFIVKEIKNRCKID